MDRRSFLAASGLGIAAPLLPAAQSAGATQSAPADGALFRHVDFTHDGLGLDPRDPLWSGGSSDGAATGALDQVVQLLLAERVAARGQKDWARADAIRDSLAAAGVVLEDRAEGTSWHLGGV